jgi:hypothetical protein
VIVFEDEENRQKQEEIKMEAGFRPRFRQDCADFERHIAHSGCDTTMCRKTYICDHEGRFLDRDGACTGQKMGENTEKPTRFPDLAWFRNLVGFRPLADDMKNNADCPDFHYRQHENQLITCSRSLECNWHGRYWSYDTSDTLCTGFSASREKPKTLYL